jgi:hypothetical protein
MFEVNTYNPSDVVLLIGKYSCVGWDEISIKRTTPTFKMTSGIKGKNTRTRSSDTSALVGISLMQVSPTNDVFSEIHTQDILYGTGRIELLLQDKSGNSLFTSSEAYIVGYADKIFKDNIEYVPWYIQCLSTESYVVGGNTRPNTELINKALQLFS